MALENIPYTQVPMEASPVSLSVLIVSYGSCLTLLSTETCPAIYLIPTICPFSETKLGAKLMFDECD
jgi:hypothetical protein